jgi:NAD(P)-dependent dehydrogenase (short-subunit alcohol dehydrogenase family)
MNRFVDKTVVITGASSGIGAACAEAFIAEGATVILVARSAATLKSLATASGPKAHAHACDVTDAAAVDALFAALPACDILINNAGSNTPQPMVEVTLETLDHLLALNVRAAFVVAQAAVRTMLRHGRSGCIVNMSSQMGHVGASNRTVYCMSKHAIEGLTKAMAVELGPQGIRVNAVSPTYIETPLTKPFFDDGAFRSETVTRIPLGRIGTTTEVAAAVLFLSSPEAGLITGTSLLVDGGYTAQ